MADFRTWLTASASGGCVVWLVAFVLWWQHPLDLLAMVELLLLLAVLVNTPLALSLIHGSETCSFGYQWAMRLQPFAALAVAWALLGTNGWWTGLLLLPWLLFTGLLALSTLQRLHRFPNLSIPERTRMAAMVYLPIGAAWLLAYQVGLQPLGFSGIIVLLTAVHFHFTGFAATIWVSMIGESMANSDRYIYRRIYPWATAGFVAATPVIAVGITLSPLIEIIGVLLLTVSLLMLAIVLYRAVLPTVTDQFAKGLLSIAPLAMLAAITLAVIYGIGEYRQVYFLTIPQMVQWHGWLNAVGFVFCGLLGWRSTLRGAAGHARESTQGTFATQTIQDEVYQ